MQYAVVDPDTLAKPGLPRGCQVAENTTDVRRKPKGDPLSNQQTTKQQHAAPENSWPNASHTVQRGSKKHRRSWHAWRKAAISFIPARVWPRLLSRAQAPCLPALPLVQLPGQGLGQGNASPYAVSGGLRAQGQRLPAS
jgi:hypothetical protein